MITKKIKRSDDLVVQFTEDELAKLNVKPGDKFSMCIEDDSILLKKYETLDVDISEWSREVLEMLIAESVKQDISVNDVICDILDEYLLQDV